MGRQRLREEMTRQRSQAAGELPHQSSCPGLCVLGGVGPGLCPDGNVMQSQSEQTGGMAPSLRTQSRGSASTSQGQADYLHSSFLPAGSAGHHRLSTLKSSLPLLRALSWPKDHAVGGGSAWSQGLQCRGHQEDFLSHYLHLPLGNHSTCTGPTDHGKLRLNADTGSSCMAG